MTMTDKQDLHEVLHACIIKPSFKVNGEYVCCPIDTSFSKWEKDPNCLVRSTSEARVTIAREAYGDVAEGKIVLATNDDLKGIAHHTASLCVFEDGIAHSIVSILNVS